MIATGKAKIEEDIRVIGAMLLNTQNPDALALGLENLKAIYARLQLVSNDMQKAKCLLLGHEAMMSAADRQSRNPKSA